MQPCFPGEWWTRHAAGASSPTSASRRTRRAGCTPKAELRQSHAPRSRWDWLSWHWPRAVNQEAPVRGSETQRRNHERASRAAAGTRSLRSIRATGGAPALNPVLVGRASAVERQRLPCLTIKPPWRFRACVCACTTCVRRVCDYTSSFTPKLLKRHCICNPSLVVTFSPPMSPYALCHSSGATWWAASSQKKLSAQARTR